MCEGARVCPSCAPRIVAAAQVKMSCVCRWGCVGVRVFVCERVHVHVREWVNEYGSEYV